LAAGSLKMKNNATHFEIINDIRSLETTDISKGPIIMSKGKLFHAAVGDRVSFDCVIDNIGTLVRLWKQGPRVIFAGDMRVRRDQRLSVERGSGELVIRGVEEADRGAYECEVETDGDVPVFIRHTLDILRPPSVMRYPRNGLLLADEGSNTSLRCSATGNPTPSVKWTKYGAMHKVLSQGELLKISIISRADSGVYVCTADNGMGGSIRRRIKLEVTYPPVIETSKSTLYTGSGHDFAISCHVDGNPKAEVAWIRNNRHIIKNQQRLSTAERNGSYYLSVKNVTKQDFGEYICEAINKNGIRRKNIVVVGSPKAPVITDIAPSMFERRHKVSWVTKSFIPLLEHILLLRKNEPFNSFWQEILLTGHSTNGVHFDHSLLNLTENTSYSVRIRARNDLGWSKLSEEIMFNTTDNSFTNTIMWDDISGVKDKTAEIILFVLSMSMLINNMDILTF